MILCTEVTTGLRLRWSRLQRDTKVLRCRRDTVHRSDNRTPTQMEQVAKRHESPSGGGVILCTEVTTGLRLRWSRLQRDTKVLGCRRDTVHRSDNRTPTQMEQVAKRHESPWVQA